MARNTSDSSLRTSTKGRGKSQAAGESRRGPLGGPLRAASAVATATPAAVSAAIEGPSAQSPATGSPADEAAGAGEADAECFTPALQHFFARAYWLVLALPYGLIRAWNVYFLSANQDLQHYFEAGSQFVAGKVPYRDFACEYPPGALPFFALPRLFTANFATYERVFAGLVGLFDVAILVLLAVLGRRAKAFLSPRSTAVSWHFYALSGQLTYLWVTGSLGYLAFERYDLIFAGFVLGWFVATTSRRAWAQEAAALLLAISVAVKLVSVLLVPLWLLYVAHEHAMVARERGEPAAAFWRPLVRPLLVFGAVLTASLLPCYIAAGSAFFHFINYHSDRGLHIETTGAAVLLALHAFGALVVKTRFAYGATEVVHPLTKGLIAWAPIVTLLCTTLTWQRARDHLATTSEAFARTRVLARAALATLLLQMACNKVLSPQYFLWAAPMLAAIVTLRVPRVRTAVVGLVAAFGLTSLILFFYYLNLLRLEPMGIYLQASRNVLLWAAALALADFKLPAFWQPLANRALAAVGRLATAPWWARVSVGLAGFWALLANFSETTANDIWIQLRSGEDIVRSGSVPYTEVYSAVVSGRPFIAHEWLCGVFFYLSTLVLGDAGLSVMTAIVALGTFVAMYYTCPKEQRDTLYYVPLLLYSTYLVAFRVLVRPHIFTIWAQAALILAIEHWRRRGGIRSLAWLIGVQVVWINLHGAALFGPALMGMVTGLTLLAVIFPELDRTNPRRFTLTDVRDGAIMTVLLGLACFVNPYGTRIVAFSVDLLANEYAKSRVWEWTTPFLQMNTYYYWLWIWLVELSLLWFGLLLRLSQRPIFDLAYATLATYLGVRANRFMPDFALLSFPVMARSLHMALKGGLKAPWHRRQPWLELSLTALLLCNCVVYGYAHSWREHRPLPGWGYGGDMPYAEVDLLKKLKVRGTIYNEYSDGSLIINRLWPDIRPVLDSRIDLYPLDLVNEYDTAYVNAPQFAAYLKKRQVNVVMMYKNRAQPGIVQYLETNPQWRRLSDTNNRLLYVTRDSLRRRTG